MPEHVDYLKLLERRAQNDQAQHVHNLRTVLPKVMEVTHKAQTVVDHVGWQWFLDALATRMKDVERLQAAKREAMIFGKAMGHELELLKIELNTIDAELRALQYASDLIPQAIQHGQDIVTGVASQAAAGSADHSRVVISQPAAGVRA